MVWQVKITVFQQRRIRGLLPRNGDRPPSFWGMVGQGLEAEGRGDTEQIWPDFITLSSDFDLHGRQHSYKMGTY